MSRSGYHEDCDDLWSLIRWRGAVASAIRGRRGQAFLREMLEALDGLSQKRLIKGDLQAGGEVCAIGSVGVKRGMDMTDLDPYDRNGVAAAFDIAPALGAEIVFENDEAAGYWVEETPERRWQRVRDWVAQQIR